MSEVARMPAWWAQTVRYVLAGGGVAIIYISLTTGLLALGLPTQLALAIGYSTGVSIHFLLYRHVVFVTDRGYALSPGAQGKRFLLVVGIQYLVTALSLGLLPDALGVSRIVVYLATVGVVTCVSFIVLRLFLFHPESS